MYVRNNKWKVGSGANWVYPSALAQEIPFFELHQPEALCIATYMNAATNFGFLSMLTYSILCEYGYFISYSYSVPFLLVISSFGCFFTALLYPVTVYNISLFLYIGCAIGGTAGALSSVIFNPYMSSYNSSMISAARAVSVM